MHKASLSGSPLARPKTLIHQLAVEVQDWFYLPDPSPLYAILGTIAANMIEGPMVWMMLVGPSGCGKTELLMNTLGIPGIFDASSIDSIGALLSGTSKKEIARQATGGLLREIGAHGGLVIDDFSSAILSLQRDTREKIMGAFRQISFGRYSRPIGSDGGKRLTWEGKLAMLAGGTPTVDQYHYDIAKFGERWLYYRYPLIPNGEAWGESRAAVKNRDPQKGRLEIREAISAFLGILELKWSREGERSTPRRELSPVECSRLIVLASLSARMRSGVVRDTYSKEIVDIPQPERPQRLVSMLGQLYLGLEKIGLDSKTCWRLTGKVAIDSAPVLRAEILKALWMCRDGLENADIRSRMQCSLSTINRAVEELEVHQLVWRDKKIIRLNAVVIEDLERIWES